MSTDLEIILKLEGASFRLVKSHQVTSKKTGKKFFIVELSNEDIGNAVVLCNDEIPTKLVLGKDFQTMRLAVRAIGDAPVVGAASIVVE